MDRMSLGKRPEETVKMVGGLQSSSQGRQVYVKGTARVGKDTEMYVVDTVT